MKRWFASSFAALAALCAALIAVSAGAQDRIERPVKILVGFAGRRHRRPHGARRSPTR